jgi:hypothetical protein
MCVYRRRYAEPVAALVEQAHRSAAEVALWALDDCAPALARWTIGRGPGPRLTLLNAIAAELKIARLETLIVADDDVALETGTLDILLRHVETCGFGLAQPAHAANSHWSHAITRRQRWTVARLTTFVEVGPLVVMRRPWIDRLVPFPERFGMGWGLDLVWPDLLADGCRLGIVDAVTLRHLAPVGRGYDAGPERARLIRVMRGRGLQTPADAQRTLARWPVWRSSPPWRIDEERAHAR